MNRLSEFPTEALLHEYRKNRYCFHTPLYNYHIRYNPLTKKEEVWEKVYGEYIDENLSEKYTICIYMTLSDKTKEEVMKESTVIKSKMGGRKYEYVPEKDRWMTVNHKNFMKIHFLDLYWEGQMEEIKEELSKRPHVNINGGRSYRRWLSEYKKQIKK